MSAYPWHHDPLPTYLPSSLFVLLDLFDAFMRERWSAVCFFGEEVGVLVWAIALGWCSCLWHGTADLHWMEFMRFFPLVWKGRISLAVARTP